MNSKQLAVGSEQLAGGSGQLAGGKAVDADVRPCPFCGGGSSESIGGANRWVACATCGACGPVGAGRVKAATAWNRRAPAGLVSTIRWTPVADTAALPAYDHAVAVWIPTLDHLVLRAYRDVLSLSWRISGPRGPSIAQGLVVAWAELPNGVLPAPDGGAA